MDDKSLTDLKQFITAAVAQAVADLPTKAEMDAQFAAMDQHFNRLERRFDEIETSVNTQFTACHNRRLAKLEA